MKLQRTTVSVAVAFGLPSPDIYEGRACANQGLSSHVESSLAGEGAGGVVLGDPSPDRC